MTEITSVPVPTATLLDAIHLLDAFTEVFHWGDVGLQSYRGSITSLGEELVDEIQERCAARGITDAADSKEWEFMDETRTVALEVIEGLVEVLRANGIEP